MISVTLLCEADSQVGFGHLQEVHALGEYMRQRDMSASTYVIGDGGDNNAWADARWLANSEALVNRLGAVQTTVSVWSFRRPLDANLKQLLDRLGKIRVWITDQPGEPVPVEVVVIPTMADRPRSAWPARMLLGLDYLPLQLSYAEEPLSIAQRTHDVLLTLGGADRTQASLRLLPALAGFDTTVVIGPGFLHRQQLKEMADELGVRCAEAPNGLQQLLRTHRIVVTAGGNTLVEAAASGTPAVVTWEDPHEREQGEAFERTGTAIVVGKGEATDPMVLQQTAQQLLKSTDLLAAMSSAGRRMVDGRGAARIVDAILEEAER